MASEVTDQLLEALEAEANKPPEPTLGSTIVIKSVDLSGADLGDSFDAPESCHTEYEAELVGGRIRLPFTLELFAIRWLAVLFGS